MANAVGNPVASRARPSAPRRPGMVSPAPAARLAALLGAVLIFTGCVRQVPGGAAPAPDPVRRVRAVATYSVIADLAHRVAGDRAEVYSLVPLGVDPHTYEPRPADIRRVAEAELIFYNGFNLELWFDRLVRGSGTRARVVVASEGVTPITIGDPQSQYHGAPDPHAWMDVRNVIRFYIPNIRDAFIAADPAGAAVYRRNAERYLADLERLDAWIREQVAALPPARRKLVTTENALAYFAARYGFQVVGWIYTLAPEAEPPARRIVELVERIRAEQVPALFVDLTLNPRLMQRLSQETGIPIRGALFIDSLGEPGSGGDSYEGMMRANVEMLVSGLGDGGTP